DEALEALDGVIAAFGNDPDPPLQEPVVRALVNKAAELEELVEIEGAIDARCELVRRAGHSADTALRNTAEAAKRALEPLLTRTEGRLCMQCYQRISDDEPVVP